MISVAEVAEIAGLKGVPESQIWRDWVVSHLLQALGEELVELSDSQLAAIELPEHGGDVACEVSQRVAAEGKRAPLTAARLHQHHTTSRACREFRREGT